MGDILSYFPFPNFREYQKEVLLKIQECLDSYNYIFYEAPTGAGKSGVAYTVAEYLRHEYSGLTHICVADKYLQQQYLNSFPAIALVMGRNNFDCSLPIFNLDEYFRKDVEPGKDRVTCDKAPCTLSTKYKCPHKPRPLMRKGITVKDQHGIIYMWEQENPEGEWWEVERPYCPYWVQKDAAIRSDITIHNYAYFLYESNYSKAFTKRLFGVLDEAHLIESILMNFVEESVTGWLLRRVSRHFPDGGVSEYIPEYSDIDSWTEWLVHVTELFTDILNKYGWAEKYASEVGADDYGELSIRVLMENTVERLEKITKDISDDPENWVWLKDDRRVTFKPVTIAKYSGYLFDHMEKKLLMSATILDAEKLKSYLGIDEEVKFLRVSRSTFPVQNRPFIYNFVGKATYRTMSSYLPEMLAAIDKKFIPEKRTTKGVIHTHSNAIARYIVEHSVHRDIMMTNTGRNDATREAIFQEFFDAKPPCVMVSASMDLGVDLYDDRCRWQLIVKTPYPDLSDPQISKRTKADQSWYMWQTLMAVIQTYGRGVRSETDWCETFVLDEKFRDLLDRTYSWAPPWFLEAQRIFYGGS